MPSIGTWFRLAAKAAFAFGLGIGPSQTADALYDVKPGEIAGKPGSIIRVWPLEGGGPGGGDAFRILYRSTGVNGQPICGVGRHLHPARRRASRQPQRDRLSSSDERRG